MGKSVIIHLFKILQRSQMPLEQSLNYLACKPFPDLSPHSVSPATPNHHHIPFTQTESLAVPSNVLNPFKHHALACACSFFLFKQVDTRRFRSSKHLLPESSLCAPGDAPGRISNKMPVPLSREKSVSFIFVNQRPPHDGKPERES